MIKISKFKKDGWVEFIPFDLVQEELLQGETAALKEKEERLAVVASEQQEILDSLSEEDKEELTEVLNDDNTAFLAGPVAKFSKELLNGHKVTDYAEESNERRLLEMKTLCWTKKKKLKKIVKIDSAKLHSLTKETIENLTDKQVCELLEKKWITHTYQRNT